MPSPMGQQYSPELQRTPQSNGISDECPMSSWEKLLDAPEPQSHFIQLHGLDDRLLTRNVSRYLGEGLQRGDGLLVVATPPRWKAFVRQINAFGGDPETAVRQGRLVFLDSEEALARFMPGGQPDWSRFESAFGTVAREIQTRVYPNQLRAYGEMVGLLWKAGQYAAAIRLEGFWNKLLKSTHFQLFCAYPIDVFGAEFQMSALDALLSAHTHLLPTGASGDLENAIERAIGEVLGPRAETLGPLTNANFRPSWAVMPRAEAGILSLRNNLPREAEKILARSRQYYFALRCNRERASSSA